jgi:glycosyltransferase involved in cell wall biosynthesis
VHTIRNGIDTSIFHPGSTTRDTGSGPRIGTVGRLIRDKAVDVLISAMPQIAAEHSGAELLIAGDGPERQRLEQLAVGQPVRFLGQLASPAQVADFLRGLDLFVLASRYEGLPNAVLEALACGIPVVATDVPGMAEAVGQAALLVRPDDPERLAAAVTQRLAEASRQHSAPPAALSFEEVAQQHLDVFTLALDGSR